MDKNRIKVSINGVEYILKSSEDEEYVQRVAILVDKNMREAAQSNSKLSTAMIGVLTAINFADRCIKAETELETVKSSYDAADKELHILRESKEETDIKLELLKEEIQRLKIEIVKKDTELKNYTAK